MRLPAACRGRATSGADDPVPAGAHRMLLGLAVPEPETRRIFTGLGIEVDAAASTTDLRTGRPPTHRPDLELEVNLVDELVRHHGLDNCR